MPRTCFERLPPKPEWSDKRFYNEFWRKCPAFQRPKQKLAIKAGQLFLYFYRNGSGTQKDWEYVMTVLILYMRFSGEYVVNTRPGIEILPELLSPSAVFRKEMAFVGSRGKTITFQTKQGEAKRVDSEMCTKWASNLMEKIVLGEDDVDIYLNYLGLLCLYMLRLVAASPIAVEQVIMKTSFYDMKRTWFKCHPETGFDFTPPPHADAYLKLSPALARGSYFRDTVLVWLQSSLMSERPKSWFLNRIISHSCLDAIQTNSLGVISWLLRASLVQRIPCYRLLYLIASEIRMEPQIQRILNFLKRCNDQERRTWHISRLLDASVHTDLPVKNNRRCVGVLVVLATGVKKHSDAIWKMQHLHNLEIDQKFFNLVSESAQKIQEKLNLEQPDSSLSIEDAIELPKNVNDIFKPFAVLKRDRKIINS